MHRAMSSSTLTLMIKSKMHADISIVLVWFVEIAREELLLIQESYCLATTGVKATWLRRYLLKQNALRYFVRNEWQVAATSSYSKFLPSSLII